MDSFLISLFLFYEAEQRFGLCLIFRRECLKLDTLSSSEMQYALIIRFVHSLARFLQYEKQENISNKR